MLGSWVRAPVGSLLGTSLEKIDLSHFFCLVTCCYNLLPKFENLLEDYFNNEMTQTQGLPSVSFLASKLNLSPNYLSDMLRSTTGQSSQQHIQQKLIDKAKERLSTTNLTVSEIAYSLGFEYPQSFHKLFKAKTNLSPVEFRQSFN